MRASVALSLLLSSALLGGCLDQEPESFDTALPENVPLPDSAEDASARALGWLQREGGKGAGLSLLPDRVRQDLMGNFHVRVRQLHQGVPVFGAQAIVHLNADGQVVAVSDHLIQGVNVDVNPRYAASEAADRAADHAVGGPGELTADPQIEQVVFRHQGRDHLAWKVQLHRVRGDARDGAPVVFVDAHTGAPIFAYQNLQTDTCTGFTNFYGTVEVGCALSSSGVYTLVDDSVGAGTWSHRNSTSKAYDVASSTAAFPGDPLTVNAVEAHFGARKTLEYYLNTHGRDGIDGLGGPTYKEAEGVGLITSITSYSSSYVNAFWDPVNEYMTYGDGDGVYSSSLTTLDIAGHEMTHGVIQHEAGLLYFGESGHLNESAADIFGAMVERSVLGESADTWMLAEETWTPGTDGDALRYMDDPSADGVSLDYGGAAPRRVDVHYGSGVPNLAFYLLSEGGSHPQGRSSTVVTGIGADAAAEIWYLALTEYWGPRTKFSEAALTLHLAAESLYGPGSVEAQAVLDAWTAVGVSTCTWNDSALTLAAGEELTLPDSSGAAVTRMNQRVELDIAEGSTVGLRLEKQNGSSWDEVSALEGASAGDVLAHDLSTGVYRLVVSSPDAEVTAGVSWCR